ncbi:MAG: hypothetical protein U1E49_14980 [Hyphomicrobiaceae bacterium]
MSVASLSTSSSPPVDGVRYGLALAAIALGQGLAILTGLWLAGATLDSLLTNNPALIVAETLMLAVLLWPALWLTIRRLSHSRGPGWLTLPAVIMGVLVIMTTAFGRPFQVSIESSLLNLLPLSVIVLVAACVVVESLGLGRPAKLSHRQDPGGLVA